MTKVIRIFAWAILMSVFITACGKENSYYTTDTQEYLQMEDHIENEGMDVDSGLLIFPDDISEYENVRYEYRCKYGVLDNAYMILLKINYPDSKIYDAELARLQNISCTVETTKGIVENYVEYSDELFEYPAYITIYNCNASFEYALLDNAEQEVTYVYLRHYDDFDFLQKEYRPLEFQDTDIKYDFTWENQNIYYALDSMGAHTNFRD